MSIRTILAAVPRVRVNPNIILALQTVLRHALAAVLTKQRTRAVLSQWPLHKHELVVTREVGTHHFLLLCVLLLELSDACLVFLLQLL